MQSNKRQSTSASKCDVSPQEMKRFLNVYDSLAAKIAKLGFHRADEFLDKMLDLLEENERITRYFIENCDDDRLELLRSLIPEVARAFASPLVLRSIKKLQKRRVDIDLSRELDFAALACARRLNAVATAEFRGRFSSSSRPLDAMTALAEEGDSDALFALALRYYFGEGVERDYDKARALAQQAEDQGARRASILRDLPREIPKFDDDSDA